MSNSDFDPNKFKASQRQSWDSVAKGWQKWWKTFESGAQRVSDRLVELAEIKPGQRVLDLATGIGEPAITAAKIVGNGHVLATDISAQMLAIAEERAKSLGLQDKMEFREIDAENLDSLPKLAFDAILSRWGLMFLPNPEIALRDMQRLLVSRGKLAAAVWSEPAKVPMINMSISSVREQLQAPLVGQGIPGPFSLADVDALKKSLLKAGFIDIQSESITVTFEFDSAEHYTTFNQDIVAPIRVMLANETEERKQEIWGAVSDQARRQYADPDSGRVKFDNEAICIVGRKP
ncbi:MAG: methyltransferase domain-containing protein [Thaumarchaeota archaeon]|nr:MAG: methyltransferase domain-containing protein [Nitrososphaerota archaeon]